MRALALIPFLALAACGPGSSGDHCHVDDDCSGETCTRIGVCSNDVYALRIEWTVRGMTADQPAACSGIGMLEVGVSDPDIPDDYTVAPVPCSIGSFSFDKLPRGYREVHVAAYDTRDGFLDSASGTPDDTGLVRLSLL